MKRAIYCYFLLITLLLLWCGQAFAAPSGNGPPFTAEEQQFLSSHPTVSVALLTEHVPFSFAENGTHTGFNHDLLELLATKTGLKFEERYDSWSENLSNFKKHQVDIIADISYQPERESFTLFTTPYFEKPIVVLTRDDFGAYLGLKSLQGKRIGLQKDTYFASALEQLLNFEMIAYDSVEEQCKALGYGQVDAIIQDLSSVNYYVRKNSLTNLKIVGELNVGNIGKEDLRFGVRSDLPVLHNILQKGLDSISAAEWAQLGEHWIGVKPAMAGRERIPLTEAERAFIKNHPVIRASNEMDYQPFDFAVGGMPQGYSIDLLNLLAGKIGIRVEYVNGYTWAELQEQFKLGKLDLLHSLIQSPERGKLGLFSKPYHRMEYHFITRAENPEITSIEQLYGKTVVVGKGWNLQEYLQRNYPQIKTVEVSGNLEKLDAVTRGIADACISAFDSANYAIKKNNFKNLKMSGRFNEYNRKNNVTYHFLAQNSMPELVSLLNMAIDTVTVEELETLNRKWFGNDVSQQEKVEKLAFTPEEQDWLRNRSAITMCIDPDWMPYDGIRDGKHVGISADILRLIEVRTGLSFQLVKSRNWKESLQLFKDNQCDIISMLTRTASRDADMNYTPSYLDDYIVFIGDVKSPYIANPRQIVDKKIALVPGYSITEHLQKSFPDLQVVTAESYSEAYRMVADGKADLTADALHSAGDRIKQMGLFNLKIVGGADYKKEMRIGVQKNQPLLQGILAKAVNSLTGQEINSILAQWKSVRYEQGFDYRLFWKIAAVVLVMFALGLLWMRRLTLLNREIAAAHKQAENAARVKAEFLATMSHEIRTPIHGIIGMLYLALQTRLDGEQRHYLESVDSSAKSLLGIINDILDFSKIEAGKLHIEKAPFELPATIEEVFALVKFKAREKGLALIVNYAPEVGKYFNGDRMRLAQVLTNLMSNAVKFTENGEICLNVSKAAAGRYRFAVQDTGIGLSDEQQKSLFQAFSQADGSTSRRYGGTGLGLSICKNLVNLMGGEIQVESRLGSGSCFSFEIELEKIGELAAPTREKSRRGDLSVLRGSYVLLAEDNRTNQEIVVGLLKDSGIHLLIAANGQEAVERFRQSEDKIELILMDIQMPVMDGYQATRIIREIDPAIPILALTADALEEQQDKTYAAGVTECLTKPIDVELFYRALLKFIPAKAEKAEPIESPPHEERSPLPEPRYIDIRKGLELLVGDNELYLEVLNNFAANYQDVNFQIMDDETLFREVHAIKGLSATIGADFLGEIAAELNRSHDRSLLPEFEERLRQVLEEIKTTRL